MAPVTLTHHGSTITGELALEVGPGMLARDRDRALDDALAGPLSELAAKLDSVLAAAPHRYARPTPGKDAQGLTHFEVCGRVEGDFLVPDLKRRPAEGRKASKPRQ